MPDFRWERILSARGNAGPESGTTDDLSPVGIFQWEAAGWSSRPAITEKNLTSDAVGAPPPRDIESTAIIYEGWKLIVSTRKDSDDPPQFELFRQSDDPLDQENLADQHPEVVERLEGMLEEWREVALAGQLPEGDSTIGMSQEELQRLKSLGYIQ